MSLKNLKDKFANLEPKHKKMVVWGCIGGAAVLATIAGYGTRSRNVEEFRAAAGKEQVIRMEQDMIQKTMLRETRRQLDAMHKEIEELKQDKERSDKSGNSTISSTNKKYPRVPGADEVIAKKNAEKNAGKSGKGPLPPGEKGNERWPRPMNGRNVPPPARGGRNQQQGPQMIGDITVLSNADASADTSNTNGVEAGKKKRTVYLPPSFMEAQLLTGFDASTRGKGSHNPEPLLLRIQTPAVLPNDIKAELQGCFIIAEAVGRLDKERADVRLVSLSCLSNQGKAVIDTPIKGFVTDSDSKVGLSGRVVSRMGASAARAVVAGFFGGMGDALRSSSTTQSTSALGTTSIVDSSQLAKYSLGGGLSEGADSLRDFYLTLARQSTPVIEVGAAKKVTVVVSEGKELEIREIKDDESL